VDESGNEQTQVTCSTNSDGSWLRPEINPGLNSKSLFFSLYHAAKRNGECLAALEKESGRCIAWVDGSLDFRDWMQCGYGCRGSS